MANIKSQKKRNLQNEKRRLRNKAVRTELKTRAKRVQRAAAESGDVDGELRTAQKRIAKAAEKGVIHRNQAARRISRLMRRATRERAAASG